MEKNTKLKILQQNRKVKKNNINNSYNNNNTE